MVITALMYFVKSMKRYIFMGQVSAEKPEPVF